MAKQPEVNFRATVRRQVGVLALVVALTGVTLAPAMAHHRDWHSGGHRHRHGGDVIVVVPGNDVIVVPRREVIVVPNRNVFVVDDHDDVVVVPRWISPDPSLSIQLTLPFGD